VPLAATTGVGVFALVCDGRRDAVRQHTVTGYLSARVAPDKGFDVNGTGTGSDFAGARKRSATRNRRLKAEIGERQDVNERSFALGSDALPPPAGPAMVSTLTPARLADPWSFVIAGLKEGAEPASSMTAAGSAEAIEADEDADDDTHQSGSRSGRECAGRARRAVAADRARAPSTLAETAVVTFVERFTPKSVSITWRDSTAANYCEQLWIRRIARSQGTCALTGHHIVRGDAVYGPAGRTAARPANAAQMVLAEAIEELEAAA
jgi:hypothetical protein